MPDVSDNGPSFSVGLVVDRLSEDKVDAYVSLNCFKSFSYLLKRLHCSEHGAKRNIVSEKRIHNVEKGGGI